MGCATGGGVEVTSDRHWLDVPHRDPSGQHCPPKAFGHPNLVVPQGRLQHLGSDLKVSMTVVAGSDPVGVAFASEDSTAGGPVTVVLVVATIMQ